jgi:predicted DNA-binding transcriptional regulator AlpA
MDTLPSTGFLRIKQIVGDPKANPPIPALIPVSKSTWWAGVRSGRYPKPTKSLGPGVTAWHVEDLLDFIALAAGGHQPKY